MRWRVVLVVCSLALLAVGAGVWAWLRLDPGHAHVEKAWRLHGLPLEAVVAELGQADRMSEFPMRECAGEFRVELFNVYPPGNPATAGVRIRELIWEHPGYSLAVWFHKVGGSWQALDTCRWQKGVEF